MYQNSFATSELTSDIKVNLASLDKPGRSRAAGLFSAAVSVALLVMVTLQFRDLAFSRILRMIPHSRVW